jgi:hypothetical protein
MEKFFVSVKIRAVRWAHFSLRVLGSISQGLILGKLAMEEKSNEIPVITELLDQIETKKSPSNYRCFLLPRRASQK